MRQVMESYDAKSYVTIILQPITSLDTRILIDLETFLVSRLFGYVKVISLSSALEPPLQFFNWNRRQYRSEKLIDWLHAIYRRFIDNKVLVVGIADIDAYAEGLNFVFGQASPLRKVALVYTRRLKGGLTRLECSSTFLSRVRKEVLHEIGHLLGLGHCKNRRCVMSFSNSLEDVDNKTDEFCDSCQLILKRNLMYDQK